MKSVIPREVESLWTLFTAPTVWAVHFVGCYTTVAVYCAKASSLDFGFETVRLLLAGLTHPRIGSHCAFRLARLAAMGLRRA